MKRSRGRLFIIGAVACAGAVTGATLAVAGSALPDPLTRAQVFHKGMSLKEVAAAATGNVGEIAPPCPDVETATSLKAEGIPFGPCDPFPEEGAPVLLVGPDDEQSLDPNEVVCPVAALGKGLLRIETACGPGAKIVDVLLVEVRGRPCADISYITRRGSEARRETLCEGDVPSGGGKPVRGSSDEPENSRGEG